MKGDYALSDSEFRFLSAYVYSHFGIVLHEEKRQVVYGRLVRRLRHLNLQSFAAYIDYVRSPSGQAEIEEMTNALTTNLTSFFREAHHLEHMASTLLVEKKDNLRIWSAGCSSGQEAYSIAMTVMEAIPQAAARGNRVVATDLDTAMVAAARAGRYPAGVEKEIPAPLRKNYLLPDGEGGWQISPALMRLVTVEPLNLQAPVWPWRQAFDAIFCRNVVIYFDRAVQIRLFNRMADCLAPGGWLYIGHSESLYGISDRFKLIGKTIYRKLV